MPTGADESGGGQAGGGRQPAPDWQRKQREEQVPIALPEKVPAAGEVDVPDSPGLRIAWALRGVPEEVVGVGLPADTRCLSLFLVNRRTPQPDEIRDTAFAFHAQWEIHSERPLVPRPNLRSLDSIEWEERVADLQYRDAFEFAVGHSVATEAVLEDGVCRVVRTCWIPEAEVERVALFSRQAVDIFPPPGPDRRDSFFAVVHTTDQSHARLYAGVAAQGRSLKVVMLRVYLALLAAAQKAYEANFGKHGIKFHRESSRSSSGVQITGIS